MEEEKKSVETEAIRHKKYSKENVITTPVIVLIAAVALILVFNQLQISSISGMVSAGGGKGSSSTRLSSDKSLANINLEEIKSTGHSVAAVFPVEDIKTQEDAMAIMFPIGTPPYGEELGVSYDDPVNSLSVLSKMYRPLKAEVQKNNPEAWQRFMSLASMPLGISCEYCCGVKAVGINQNGDSICGCQHNPALLAVTLYLTAYTDYSEGEILREAMRWKTIFFPKNMIELGMTVAGGDTSKLENLPGMVGGC